MFGAVAYFANEGRNISTGLDINAGKSTDEINVPTPIPKNDSGQLTNQSRFKYTYIDAEDRTHLVEDYTSQGGGKYDTIVIKSQ